LQLTKLFNCAERHKRFRKELLAKAVEQPIELIRQQATRESRILYNLHRQVLGCYQLTRAFTRLDVSPHGILYAEIEPEHHVEDMVARWFLSRFPGKTILLQSRRGTFMCSSEGLFISSERINEILPKLEKERPIDSICKEVSEFDAGIWDEYYRSQNIAERRNIRYFSRNLPKKYLNRMKTENFSRKKSMRLNRFIG